MADVISLLLTAKNDASKAINQVQKDLTQLQKSTQGAATFTDKALAIGAGAFAANAFVNTITQVVSSTAELSQAGANFERLASSFEALAAANGTSGQEIISSIDAVTQGTLSNAEIMKQANAAMLLGVANTGEEFSTLAKIAIDRGRAMGISMEYAFESIVKGVGRLSPLILDNLGIVIDADKTYADYAKTINKTADSLTDLEKRQALISRLKDEVSGFDNASVNDTASSWEKFNASMADFAASVGGMINKSTALIGVIDGITYALRLMSDEMSSDSSVQQKALNDKVTIIKAQIQAYKDLNAGVKAGWNKDDGSATPMGMLLEWANDNQIKALEKELAIINQLMSDIEAKKKLWAMEDKDAKKGIRDSSGVSWQMDEKQRKNDELSAYAMREIGTSADFSKKEIQAMVDNIIKLAPNIDVATAAVDRLIRGFANAKEMAAAMSSAINGAISGFDSAVFGAFEASGFNQDVIDTAKAMRPAFDDALASIEALGWSEYDTKAATMVLENQFSSTFLSATERINETEKALNKTGSTTVSLTKEFQGLRGIVESIFSTAQSDFEGLGIDEILPREDAVNENARRLADIAKNGFKDQSWLQEFKDEAGGAFADIKLLMASGMDAQGAAKKILKDFQNGLRPDLIDRNMVKDIAKRMFFVDQETTKMIDDIAKELAGELGISVEEAKGLAGSAMGNKKLSAEEKQKIIDEEFAGLKAKMGFDWGNKSATIQKGIDAGVLNKDGDLEITIKPVAPTSKWTSLTLPAYDGLTKDSTYNVNIQGTSKEATPFTLTIPAQSFDVEPKVNPETVKTTIDQANSNIMSTNPLKVTVTTDKELVEGAGVTAFADFANGFMNSDNLSGFGLWVSTGLANSFVEYSNAYIQTGNQVGLYIFEGFKNQGLGLAIAAELGIQLSQSQKAFENSATNAGKVWGGAFLTVVKNNVPFELLLALTDLITPEVIKRVAENGNRGSDKER